MSEESGFDSKKYIDSQNQAFADALSKTGDDPTFIEFGGKPFADHHAERVLPGYDSESKAEILRETTKLAEVVMVVNSLDILQRPDGRTLRGRIRGDSGLLYDKETVRLLDEAHKKHIPIRKVVLAVKPQQMSSDNKRIIDAFRSQLSLRQIEMVSHYQVPGYPDPGILDKPEIFEQNENARGTAKNLIAVSPGGGSGKFGVLLSEMYSALMKGEVPSFVKFETFPVYQLDAQHALNLAFESATADLKNRVIAIGKEGGAPRSSYDKDLENFILLKRLFEVFSKSSNVEKMEDAVDIGINRVVDGITDMEVVIKACRQEVARRIGRYQQEVVKGIETVETLETAKAILGQFDAIYEIKGE